MLHFDAAVIVINRNNFEQFAIRVAIPTSDFRDFYPMFLYLRHAPRRRRLEVCGQCGSTLHTHHIYTPFLEQR
jgi:hypothetical protein